MSYWLYVSSAYLAGNLQVDSPRTFACSYSTEAFAPVTCARFACVLLLCPLACLGGLRLDGDARPGRTDDPRTRHDDGSSG
eukprot:6199357-Pleurochrysis_carterae.AAC.2